MEKDLGRRFHLLAGGDVEFDDAMVFVLRGFRRGIAKMLRFRSNTLSMQITPTGDNLRRPRTARLRLPWNALPK